MEQKCLKTPVYANETVFSESVEQPIDVDFTLPDYCPDISKIFKCKAVPRISSKGMNGRSITIDGAVTITLLYADDDGRLCSYEYQYPFSKTLETNEECSGGNLCTNIKCEYINCRAVTGRKVDIHGAAGIFVKVFRRRCCEIISDIDDSNIELKRGIAPATTPMGYAEKYLMVEEEIEIGQGQPAISRLLRYDASCAVMECKIINEKVVVKGEICLSVLYCPEDSGIPQLMKTTIPYSQIVDMEGISEGCECETKVELCFAELKPRTTAAGDTRSFIFSAKLLVCAEAYCGNDVAVVLDAFSRKFRADITRSTIPFEKIMENISDTYHCKKNIELQEDLSSVNDLWCEVQQSSSKCDGTSLTITGVVLIGIIAALEQGVATYYEKTVDFEYKHSLRQPIENIKCDPQVEILSSGYTITSARNIELRIDLNINAAVYELNNLPLITDMKIDPEHMNEKKTVGAMTIYFTSDGEGVWDIARRYNASVEEIMKINDLTEQSLPAGKMVLIPIM